MITSRTEIRGADIARHYDSLDAFYREVWGDCVHHGLWRTGRESLPEARLQLEQLIATEAELRRGGQVCDIGCGYGATARNFAAEYGVEVTGITISPAQHAAAASAAEGRDNPRFILGDWLTAELPDGTFDAAYAIESSEHMPDKTAFFSQAARILRIGGRLIVTGWLVGESTAAWQRRWLLEPICRESRMPQLGSESEYRAFAAGTGFSVERFQDITRLIARTWPMIARAFLAHVWRHPSSVRIFLHPGERHHIFGLTIARLCTAFRIGALRYGVFTLVKSRA